jgi:hypothetical protein
MCSLRGSGERWAFVGYKPDHAAWAQQVVIKDLKSVWNFVLSKTSEGLGLVDMGHACGNYYAVVGKPG